MLKQKYQNKLILVFSFLLIIIFVISLFFFQQNGENSQTIKAKLITSVHKDLPFEFETEEANVLIVPGEVKTINMTKLNCFCYEEQTLKGGEKEKYSLVLLVDPKVTKNVKEAIIQFVFFKK